MLIGSSRTAVRSLRRSPAFTSLAALCLSLGVGSTVAVFSVVDAFVLRPLPFAQPGRLLSVWKSFDSDGVRDLRYFLKPADFLFLQRESRLLEVAAAQPVDVDLTGEGEPIRVRGAKVSGSLFGVLGLTARAGRLLVPGDEEQGVAACVVTSGLSGRRFGGPAAALGQVVAADGRPCTVVGVVDDRLAFPDGTELWVPLTRQEYEAPLGVSVVGRLRGEATPNDAVAEVEALGRRLVEVDPERNSNAGLAADGLQAALAEDLQPVLRALATAALCLLLIASANTACLVLARGKRRAGEAAVRAALGASRARLLADTAYEALLLGAMGGAGGLVLAGLAVPVLVAVSPVELFTFAPANLGARVVGFGGATALVTALLACFFPSLLAALAPEMARLTAEAAPAARTTGRRRALSALVVADVAITVVLLMGTGLSIRTVQRLTAVDPGFYVRGLYTVGVSAPPGWSEDQLRRMAFFSRVEEEVASLPGIRAVGATHSLPMTQPEFYWSFNVEGRPPADPDGTEIALFRSVTHGYLEAMSIPLREGRWFGDGDRSDGPGVAVVNETMAALYWPGKSPLGRRLKGGRWDSEQEWIEVAGVVGDARDRGVEKPVGPALFRPLAQWDRRYTSRMILVIRHDPNRPPPVAAIRDRVAAVAADAVLFDPRPMSEVVTDSMRRQQFTMTLLAVFAGLAVLQAAAGLCGVVSYDVQSRTRELGVRLAVGAGPAQLRRLVMGSGLAQAAAGLLFGCLAAAALSRVLSGLVVDLPVFDPLTCLGVVGVTVVVVVAATWLPARRAVALDPVRALRS